MTIKLVKKKTAKALLPPLPKNVGRLISEYVDREKGFVFFTLTTCLSLNFKYCR